MHSTQIPLSVLADGARALGVELSAGQLDQFCEYARLLVEWNERMNLTAITDPEGIAVRHFVDSLTLLRAAEPTLGAKLLDVGAGAGFPSMPACIARPDLKPTLLDSLNKRLIFLHALSEALAIPAELVHQRAEDAGRMPEYREGFDLVCARAVARLSALCEYCLPFVRVGGCFAALKGPDGPQELHEAGRAIDLLGGGQARLHPFTLPDGSERVVVTIKKLRPTPTKYPRKGTKIVKLPL